MSLVTIGGVARMRLGPKDPDSRYGVGRWHEQGPDGEPLCGQRATPYLDKRGRRKPGSWEYGHGPVECQRCLARTAASGS